MIEWNAGNGQFEIGPGRERVAIHGARRTTMLLTGITSLSNISAFDVVGVTERGRQHLAGGIIGAHLVAHSDIEHMVCQWLNSPALGLPRFLCVVGSLIVPPMSYWTSVPLAACVTGDGLMAIIGAIPAIITRLVADPRVAAKLGNAITDFLSHTHANLRLGDPTTNLSLGSRVDARISRNRGLDPMAWAESCYQRWTGDPRPRLSAESIYAASFVRLQLDGSAHFGPLSFDDCLSWDSTGAGNPAALRSSVDGAATLRLTATGNPVLGFPAAVGWPKGVFVNPLRRAAHIPFTRIPFCVSWYGLLGLFLLVFLLFQIGVLSTARRQ